MTTPSHHLSLLQRLARRISRIWSKKSSAHPLQRAVDSAEKSALQRLLREVDPDGAPNLGALWLLLRDAEITRLNVKNMGYDLARAIGQQRFAPAPERPTSDCLGWRTSTQKDIESDWCAYWCYQLGIKPIYHRKIWELCFVLQNMHALGVLQPGKRALAFGCGQEPIASMLASRGVDVLATDLAPDHENSKGWTDTAQHGSNVDKIWHPHLVSRDAFDRHVTLEYVDMREIPSHLQDFDACWSICALEHLGSISSGLDFVEKSLVTLKPGGVALHTTEFNVKDGATIDNWPTVLFQRHHFEALANRLRAAGHEVDPISFDVGSDALDRFVDIPPYHDLPENMSLIQEFPAHLKLSIDGFPSTCFGIVIRKATGQP